MKKEVKSIVKNIAIPTVDEFVKNLPMDYIQIKAAWFAFKNSYGLFADLFQDEAIEKLATIISILEENDVPERNAQTSNLSFYPEYDWKGDEGRKLIGQRVSQTLTIKIPEIDKNPGRVTDILDALGTINGLELNSVNFDIEDKKEFFSEAREQAFEKAYQKAKELAKFGDVELGKPITISESSVNYRPIPYQNFAKMEMVADGMGGGSALPAGELDVTASVNVLFEIR